jgi:hypothetical protein
MVDFADLMRRLVEIQRGERRSAKLIEEDERLMARLQKRILARKPPQGVGLSQDSVTRRGLRTELQSHGVIMQRRRDG